MLPIPVATEKRPDPRLALTIGVAGWIADSKDFGRGASLLTLCRPCTCPPSQCIHRLNDPGGWIGSAVPCKLRLQEYQEDFDTSSFPRISNKGFPAYRLYGHFMLLLPHLGIYTPASQDPVLAQPKKQLLSTVWAHCPEQNCTSTFALLSCASFCFFTPLASCLGQDCSQCIEGADYHRPAVGSVAACL